MQPPIIYAVLAFRVVDGKRFCYQHLVAAFDSNHAEQVLFSHHHECLRDDELYIVTDAVTERDPLAAVRLYTTGTEASSDPHKVVGDDEHRNWVRVMTRDSWGDGERVPAAFRRIHATPT
jgi:hypothetical protein